MENKKSTNKLLNKGIIGLLSIIIFITVIVLLTKIFTKNKDISTKQEDLQAAGAYEAEQNAIKDIEIDSNSGILKLNELTCNAKEVINNNIVVVLCNTTKEEIIKYYGSKKIYYAYLKTGENTYNHHISKNKEEAINKIK